MLRRTLLLLCALALLLSGTGAYAKTGWTVKESEESSAETLAGGVGMLFNRNGVSLEVTGISFLDGQRAQLRFDVWVTNETDSMLNLHFDDVFVDGQEVDGFGIYDLASGASIPEYFFFEPKGNASADFLRNPSDVSFDVRVQFDSNREDFFTQPCRLTGPLNTGEREPQEQLGDGSDTQLGSVGTLVDQNGILLEIMSVAFKDGDMPLLRFDVWVENHTGRAVYLSFDDAYADGTEVDGVGIFGLADGEAIEEYFFFTPLEGRSAEVLKNPNSLSFTLNVRDDATYDTILSKDFTLTNPASGGSLASEELADGPDTQVSSSAVGTLVDRNGVSLEVTGVSYRELDTPVLRFDVWVENHTGRTVYLSFENAYADGTEVEGIGIYNLQDGASTEEYFFFQALEGRSPEVLRNPRSLSFTLIVRDDATYETILSQDFTLTEPNGSSGSTRYSSVQPTAAPDYAWLEKGDKGDDVRRLQLALIFLGYLSGSADGIYGDKTAQAVYDFKKQNGLLTGVFDNEASPAVQEVLFGGSAQRYSEPPVSLEINYDSNGQWDDVSGDRLKMRVEVHNASKSRTVKAFELYMYATDVWGNRIYGEDQVYYDTTTKNIGPGKTAYSDYLVIPYRSEIDKVYVGISKVVYTNGTVEEPDSVDYWNWEIW